MGHCKAKAMTEVVPNDRRSLKQLAHLLLESMVERDVSLLPIARSYAMTTNGCPSAPGMSELWRTITGFKEPADFQYVIDAPEDQVFVIAEVEEGGAPNLFWGRMKVEEKKVAELELYIGRSNASSGFMFDPTGLVNMPEQWAYDVPYGQKASRERLLEVAACVFDPELGTPAASQEGYLVENGERVMGHMTVESMKEMIPWATDEMLDRINRENAKPHSFDAPGYAHLIKDKEKWRNIIGLGCDFMADRPTDKNAYWLADEVQGICVSFGMVAGHIYPSFYWWTPILETAFVPASMLQDMKLRENTDNPEFNANAGRDPALPYIPISKCIPGVLSTIEIIKFHDEKIQGEHRVMQIQPAGSVSPWVHIRQTQRSPG